MKKYIKNLVVLLCMMTTILLSGCAGEKTNSAINDTDSAAMEDGAEAGGADGKEASFEEIDGVVYVDGEELSLEKLLAMVGEASAEYRYSSLNNMYGNTCMDYLTRQIISTNDRDWFIRAYDTLSNSYYRLNVSGTSCQVLSSEEDPELYTSLLDYMLRDDLQYYHDISIGIDDASIPGKVCYKLATTRTINEKTVCQDFFIDANTNLYTGYALWNADDSDSKYVIEEVKYSNEPLINFELEYELPTEDDNNTYEWYTGDVKQETAEETPIVSETQTYYVKLLSYGDSLLLTIKAYRDQTGADLSEAKAAIESAPCVILETTDLEKAQAMAAALEAQGAIVDDDMLSSEITDVSEEIGAGDEAGETVGEEAVSEIESTDGSEESEVEPVEVYGELDYPDDDWRSAGFYINGTFAKLPMTYEELSELGFDKLCNKNGIELAQLQAESYTIPAYSFRAISSIEAYNSLEECIYPAFVNVEAEEKYITDCMIYSLRFVDYKRENRSGYGELPEDIKICNGISWDTTYDEVIALMGEPDEVIDVSNEEGFCGTLTYHMEEENIRRYVEIGFFEDSVDDLKINAMPIDAHLIAF